MEHSTVFMRTCAALALGTALSFSASGAMAQLPADASRAATGTASPDRIQEQLLDQELSPRISSKVQVEDAVLESMPANAENIRFKLDQIQFEDIGVYTGADIESIYADKLGTTVTLADIYRIAQSLTRKYRNDGYILTRVYVPPQTIDGGVVKLRAVEGFIDQIRVEGNDQASAMDLIRSYAGRIQSESSGALNIRELEKFLLIINDLPGVEARSILSPSKTRTGASDLRVIVERDPYDAVVGVDNFGSRYLGPLQFTAAGSLNSHFGNNERITVQAAYSPDKDNLYELGYFALGYDQPIGTHGTVIKTFYSHSSTRPGFDLEQFNVKGHSDFMSVQAEHPFLRSRARSLFGHLTFDWRDTNSRNDLETTREDSIRAVRAGGRYEFLDSLFGAGANLLSLEVAQGLDVFGATKKGSQNISRAAGDPTFLKANMEVQRLQRITNGVNLLVAGRGQLANNPLLSSEEFGVGGVSYGRAFDPSEIVGDDGIAGKAELQWRQPVVWDLVQDYMVYGFYDIGKVWNQDATTSTDKKNSLASAGLGVRADVNDDVEAGFAVAVPLTRDVETQRDDDPRVYFNLNRKF